MSIKSAPFYWVECDGKGCGANAQEFADHSAWKQSGYAVDEAIESDWVEMGDKHYCTECRSQLNCEECGEYGCDCKEETK